jgi:hypothetical protein
LETLEIARWEGPFPAAVRLRALEALENGKVLYFPNLAFALTESARFLLSSALSDGRAKNVSLDPASGSVRGTLATDRERLHLDAMMEAFAGAATSFVSDLFPSYAANLERARTSYRPVEIVGRQYSRLDDDTLLHIDAFPSTPTQGRRILRIFSNINSSGKPRILAGRRAVPRFRAEVLALPGPTDRKCCLAAGDCRSHQRPTQRL